MINTLAILLIIFLLTSNTSTPICFQKKQWAHPLNFLWFFSISFSWYFFRDLQADAYAFLIFLFDFGQMIVSLLTTRRLCFWFIFLYHDVSPAPISFFSSLITCSFCLLALVLLHLYPISNISSKVWFAPPRNNTIILLARTIRRCSSLSAARTSIQYRILNAYLNLLVNRISLNSNYKPVSKFQTHLRGEL